MALLNQFKSLLQLPGAYLQSRRSASEAARVKSLADAAIARKSSAPVTAPNSAALGPVPQSSPSIPIPSAPVKNTPQFSAITSALGGLSTGLQNLSKGIPGVIQTAKNEAITDTFSPIESEITSNIAPTAEEQNIRQRLSNLLASKSLGIIRAEEQPVPLGAILGEQGRIERRAAVEQGTLQDQLAQLQAERTGRLETAKTKYDIAKTRLSLAQPDEEKISEFTNDQGQQVVSFRNKKTGAVRSEILGTTQKKASTQTDRDRALKTSAIGVARPLLIGARGADGYVSPTTYLKLRNDYSEAIGDPIDFDRTFAPMLSPDERRRLGVGTSATATASESIGSILAQYLAGGQ